MGISPWAVIISSMTTKTCVKCAGEFADEPENFPPSKKYGAALCAACFTSKRRAMRVKDKERKKALLRKVEQAGVTLFVESAKSGGSNIPHSAEVIERIFQYFGGVGGFSSIVVKQYYDSPPGGSARNRLIETLVRLVSKNVELGGAKKPLTLWSEEELEKELETRFNEALYSYKGLTLNAKATPLIAPDTTADDAKALLDAVSEGRDQVFAVGDTGTEDRSPAAVRTDSDASPSSQE